MATDPALITLVHKAFINFSVRAEKSEDSILVDTFVDSAPLIDLISSKNSQIVYGRRGTGKTHALKVLYDIAITKGDTPVFIDLRSIGSNTSIYNDLSRSLASRASQLINDVLYSVLSSFYEISVNILDRHPNPEQVTTRLDDLARALSAVRVAGGTVETENTDNDSASLKVTPSVTLSTKDGSSAIVGAEAAGTQSHTYRSKEIGTSFLHIDFSTIQSALAGLISITGIKRLWLLIDEWSEVPLELQPYLADMFRRTCTPVSSLTIKIAAIEHRSSFIIRKVSGEYIGLELGADISANINLDDFLVFDSDEARSIQFFKNLVFKHYKSTEFADHKISTPDELVQTAFTQQNVFAEFVRAVEGVPRDALNLAAAVATKAFGNKISMNNVSEAARDWYQRDKMSVISSDKSLSNILTIIINEVIGNRRARAFLFSSKIQNNFIEELFDARLLHILKKNISSKDEPGERYDVFKIDYGCYVDLKNTNRETLGLFSDEEGNYIEVPRDDYRSIRRAILNPKLLAQYKASFYSFPKSIMST